MEKIKNNKLLIIITCLLTLTPLLVALIMWDKLPDQIPMHWNVNGEVDGYGSKTMALIGLPLILVAAQGLCIFAMVTDPKRQGISEGAFRMVLLIIPVISMICTYLETAFALGKEISVNKVMMILMGVLFLFIGNYLPKSRRNYTMGIKIPWALNSDDNWNATHRVGGIVYMAIGAICLIMAFIPGLSDKVFWLFFTVMMVGSTIPVAYSYIYYLKNEKDKE